MGFVDLPSLVLGRAAGSTIRVVAVNYQKAPYANFSLDPGANVTKPADLEGLPLGSSGASFVPRIHKAFMKMHGLNTDKLKVVDVAPPARIGMLVRNKVPSIDFFMMTWTGIKRAAGKKRQVRALLLGDFVGATEGLGFLLYIANSQVDTPLVWASLAFFGALGLILFGMVVLAERILMPWADSVGHG